MDCRCKDQRWSRGHKARGQGQGHKKIPRPRSKDTNASVLQKKGLQKFFSSDLKKRSSKNLFRRKRSSKIFLGGKGLQKFFSGDFHLRKTKKRSSQIFCEVSGAFQQNINGSKNSDVLEARTGQFSRT